MGIAAMFSNRILNKGCSQSGWSPGIDLVLDFSCLAASECLVEGVWLDSQKLVG